MNDDALRELVRAAVARHLGRGPAVHPAPHEHAHAPVPAFAAGSPRVATVAATASHPSHAEYHTLVNTTDACVIEPSVPCEHCGYCKSHGH